MYYEAEKKGSAFLIYRATGVVALRVVISGKKFERSIFKWPADAWNEDKRMILPSSSTDKDYLDSVKAAILVIEKAKSILGQLEQCDIQAFADAWEGKQPKGPTLKEAMHEYMQGLEASFTTARIYRGRAKAILSILGGEILISEIKLHHLEMIDDFIRKNKKTASSALLCHAVLRGTLKAAYKRGQIKENPYFVFRCSVKRREQKRAFVPEKAIQALFEHWKQEPDGKSRLAMQLFLIQAYTGARYSDAKHICQANFEAGYYIAQKTGKKSTLYMSKRLQLLRTIEPIGMGYQLYRTKLAAVSEILGHDYTKTHAARRYFATKVYEASGNNLKVAQQALGHSSVTTTEKYIGVDANMLQDAVLSMGE